MNPIVLIGAGAVILLAGIGLGYWFGNSGRKHESEKASELQAELDGYRRDVTEHFSETAAHFQSLGKEYRKLYEHMALGAGTLCRGDQAGQALRFAPVELLTAAEATEETGLEPVIPDAPADAAASATELQHEVVMETPVDSDQSEPSEDLASEPADEILADNVAKADAEKTYH